MGTFPRRFRERGARPHGESREMQPADPARRRQALLVVVVVAVACAAMLGWLRAETARIRGLFEVDPGAAAAQASSLFLGVTWAAGAVALIAAILVGRIAREVRLTGRYPPPGARLLRDTMVRTGARAERIARVGTFLAVLLAIAAPVLVVMGHRLVAAFAAP